AEADWHILKGYLLALDALDAVIDLIRNSPTVEDAKAGLQQLLGVDDEQATAILNLQLRRLAALERQKILDQAAELEKEITEYKVILGSAERQREIIMQELTDVVERFGDDRRTEILAGFDSEMRYEDLVPDEQMVITLTRGGYIKRTRADSYRRQHRGGRGIRGAQLRSDDVVEHFFVTSTHRWLLFFTNLGRVYRAKAYEIAEAGRDAKGQHVANVLALQPDEQVAQVLDIPDYEVSQYLVLATKQGMVKKTVLTTYDTPRQGGVIAINLREGDEVVRALLVNGDEDIMLISRAGQSLRFSATDDALRPMGRATAGVIGMHFRGDDELLTANVVNDEWYVFVVTEGGYAKRTAVGQYRQQGRGGMGIKVAKLNDSRGNLAGGLIVGEEDEVLVVLESGKVVRSVVSEVPAKGRDTMGVVFCRFAEEDKVLAIARSSEQVIEAEVEDSTLEGSADQPTEEPT
ncbi:MAG: DNA gyrase C-terminal beta-propeller domain-containing protein, partial [Pontimonas sp.]